MNFAANAVLLIAKLSVALLTNSLSVLASLVDGEFRPCKAVLIYKSDCGPQGYLIFSRP